MSRPGLVPHLRSGLAAIVLLALCARISLARYYYYIELLVVARNVHENRCLYGRTQCNFIFLACGETGQHSLFGHAFKGPARKKRILYILKMSLSAYDFPMFACSATQVEKCNLSEDCSVLV